MQTKCSTNANAKHQHNTLSNQEETNKAQAYAELSLQYASETAADSRKMSTVGYVGSIFLPPMLTAVRIMAINPPYFHTTLTDFSHTANLVSCWTNRWRGCCLECDHAGLDGPDVPRLLAVFAAPL